MNNASKNPGLPQYSINIKGSKHGVCPKTKIGKMFDIAKKFYFSTNRFLPLENFVNEKVGNKKKLSPLWDHPFKMSANFHDF